MESFPRELKDEDLPGILSLAAGAQELCVGAFLADGGKRRFLGRKGEA